MLGLGSEFLRKQLIRRGIKLPAERLEAKFNLGLAVLEACTSYGHPWTCEAIAEACEVERSTISQITREALRKAWRNLNSLHPDLFREMQEAMGTTPMTSKVVKHLPIESTNK